MTLALPRQPARTPWPLEGGLGNHRVVLNADGAEPYVKAEIEWRRRDLCPENTAMLLFHLPTNTPVVNVTALSLNRENCVLVFEAAHAGEYALYYLPYRQISSNWWFPIVEYSRKWMEKPDAGWLARIPDNMPRAQAKYIESRTAFDSFDPMEIPASREESAAFLNAHGSGPLLIRTEDRTSPIRMKRELPLKWIQEGPRPSFEGTARPREYYVLQIGLIAREELAGLEVRFDIPPNPFSISPNDCTCFQTEGLDWRGKAMKKAPGVSAGEILPLWIGVDLPAKICGTLRFSVQIASGPVLAEVPVTLSVAGENIEHRGDAELWRLSRLRWLNSSVGLGYEHTEPYDPMVFHRDERRVSCTGRHVTLGNGGLPAEIVSFFTPELRIGNRPLSVLEGPMAFEITTDGAPIRFTVSDRVSALRGSGHFSEKTVSCSDALRLTNQTEMEYDGHLDIRLTLTALEDVTLDNAALRLTMSAECSTYMMGMGCEGGLAPDDWHYSWDEARTNNFVWLGGINGGLHVKLKHTRDVWELYTYEVTGLPKSWSNGGKGGCRITRADGRASVNAYSGAFSLQKGEHVTFRVALMITPLKPMDSDAHWRERYGNAGTTPGSLGPCGATVLNLHQGDPLNRYINYPFREDDKLREEIQKAHEKGLKYKLYYTIRELSAYAEEFWAMRALGDEIFLSGPSFRVAEHFIDEFFNQDKGNPSTGGPWLCEHLVEGYIPAWQTVFEDRSYDCSLATAGLSRWHNYYLEGLRWLTEKIGADGIYLDGVGYDRDIMKRVRRVLNDTKPGCLVDLHSGNNFHPEYGLCNVLGQYMELLPSVDSLWIGEAFDYERTSPEYWLVEISGVPFGLMSDMLHRGGNKWRGMVFGMTPRLGWPEGGDPLPVWRLWEEFGMESCVMFGWWSENCPVRVSAPDVKATAYVQEDRAMIAVASWAAETVSFTLDIDFGRLPLSGVCAEIPEIDAFQKAEEYALGALLTVEPGKGKIIVLRRKDRH